jgi:hypothetical protein
VQCDAVLLDITISVNSNIVATKSAIYWPFINPPYICANIQLNPIKFVVLSTLRHERVFIDRDYFCYVNYFNCTIYDNSKIITGVTMICFTISKCLFVYILCFNACILHHSNALCSCVSLTLPSVY